MTLETFGGAGTPPVQFNLRLRFGYYVTVVVWETRELLRLATKLPRIRKRRYGCFDRSADARSGRRFGILHLCIPALDEDTLLHELKHVFFWFEAEIASSRYRRPETMDEAMATEFPCAYLALRSHLAEERRIGTI